MPLSAPTPLCLNPKYITRGMTWGALRGVASKSVPKWFSHPNTNFLAYNSRVLGFLRCKIIATIIKSPSPKLLLVHQNNRNQCAFRPSIVFDHIRYLKTPKFLSKSNKRWFVRQNQKSCVCTVIQERFVWLAWAEFIWKEEDQAISLSTHMPQNCH